jgi:septal ring factor EnvC (AmiA/AmiB activator)
MNYPSTGGILATAKLCGGDLNDLAGLLDTPRDALLQRLRMMQTRFATLESGIALGLEGRDHTIEQLEAAEQARERLEKQVRAMQAEILALQARIDRLDGGDDRSTALH